MRPGQRRMDMAGSRAPPRCRESPHTAATVVRPRAAAGRPTLTPNYPATAARSPARGEWCGGGHLDVDVSSLGKHRSNFAIRQDLRPVADPVQDNSPLQCFHLLIRPCILRRPHAAPLSLSRHRRRSRTQDRCQLDDKAGTARDPRKSKITTHKIGGGGCERVEPSEAAADAPQHAKIGLQLVLSYHSDKMIWFPLAWVVVADSALSARRRSVCECQPLKGQSGT